MVIVINGEIGTCDALSHRVTENFLAAIQPGETLCAIEHNAAAASFSDVEAYLQWCLDTQPDAVDGRA